MNTMNRPIHRWNLVLGNLGVVVLILACAVLSGEVQPDKDNGTEVQNKQSDLMPVVSEAIFELTGELESIDPWTVAGTKLETNASTQIEEGLKINDLVHVRGAILDDGIWVAYSIELATEQTDPIIVLIGVVDSIDPWSVNGIELNVTDETIIEGEVTPGMIVRVDILLLSDGTWEVLNITPLGEITNVSGCVTVIATVVSVQENEIQFLGWPEPVQFDENAQDSGDIAPDQVVLVVGCSQNGQLVIVQIIVLKIEPEGGDDTSTDGGEKVLICHKPDKKDGNTLSISVNAVPAHLAHGDKMGACPH